MRITLLTGPFQPEEKIIKKQSYNTYHKRGENPKYIPLYIRELTCAFVVPLSLCVQLVEFHSPPGVSHGARTLNTEHKLKNNVTIIEPGVLLCKII